MKETTIPQNDYKHLYYQYQTLILSGLYSEATNHQSSWK